MKRRRTLLLALSPLVLAGCGFALRRTPDLPFQRIALLGFSARSPLAEELQRQLSAKARVVATPGEAEVVLRALSDGREKSVVASTSSAQVREYQLRVRLEFELTTPGGRELIAPTELLLKRDMSYAETFALAKEQEEQQLYRAMQGDIVGQLMRRLARVKLA